MPTRRLLYLLFAAFTAITLHAQAPGDLDPLDATVVGSYVQVTAVQPDGKTIIAGEFSSVGGVPRNRIARLNADGSLDLGFDPNVDATVISVAVQADGKILLGGVFTSLQPNGAASATTRHYIARLNADGSLDPDFDPNADGFVFSVAVQVDGKIVLSGRFTSLQPNGAASATTRHYIARLNADGSLDVGFDPNADGFVDSVAVQADGKILLGGFFSSVGSMQRNHLARVDAAGSLDLGFDPNVNNTVESVAVQADGKILFGGYFTMLQPTGAASPTARNCLARVNADGSVDPDFDPNVNDVVYSVAVQTDGKLLLGGNFTTLQPNGAATATTRNRLARVNADGSLDLGFDPNASDNVYSVAVQANGKILVAGAFTTLQPNGAASPTPRNLFARLANDAASATLSVPDATQVLWTRGDGSPEVSQVTFELSIDGGSTWSTLGAGARLGTSSNWQLTGLSLATSGSLRARGRTTNGFSNGGSGLIEQVVVFPIYTLGNSSLVEGPGAGSDSVVLSASAEIGTWAATANDSWLHVTAGSESGTGSANVLFSFDANAGATRTGTLTIAGQTLTITQAGSSYVAAGGITALVSTGLNDPEGVAVDGAGNVFIADTANNAIKKWTAATQTVTTLISMGVDHPAAVTVDGDGNLYIAENYTGNVKKWTAATQAVSTIAHVGSPGGVAVDGFGNVYFSDYSNGVVQKWTAATQTVSTVVTGLNGPTGVAVDAAGNVYVADYFNLALKKWTAATQTVSTLISSGLSYPQGVAVDGSGNVYVADSGNRALKKWTAATQALTTIISTATVSGVAVDGTGDLFFTDYFKGIRELPRAFVDPSAKSVGYTAGSGMLPAVLPATQNLLPPFAPTSDDPSWLTIDSISDGVVHFSFTTNTTTTARTAHLALLGQSIAITQAAPPPAGLTYSTNPATYGTSVTIADNTPSSTGGAVDSYSVSPALPAGLSLDTTTGVVSGTPTTVTAAADYTVTATNASGMTTTVVNITVIDRTPPTIAAPTGGFTPLMVYAGTLPDYHTQAVTSDNIAVTSVTQTPAAGSATVAGRVQVTLTAHDAAGNTADTAFYVTVHPLNAPHVKLLSTGDDAPGAGTIGLPVDAKLASLGVPAIDGDSDIAFLAKWTSASGGKGSGLFLYSSCLGIVGGDAPIAGAKYKSFTDPVIDSNNVACIAALTGTPKPPATVVLSNANGSPALGVIARAGDVAPGLDGTQPGGGAKFKSFKAVSIVSGSVAIFAQLTGGTGVEKATAGTDLGIWIKDGTNPLKLAVREGQMVGPKMIKTLVSFAAGAGSPGQGRGWLAQPDGPAALALALFTDKSQAVISATAGGGLQVFSQTGATGTNGGPDITNATFASYSFPATNNSSTAAFLASMTVGTSDVTRADARGVFLSDGTGKYTPLARVSKPAGATGANFSVLKDPVLAQDGALAFPAMLKGGTVKGLAATTLWWKPVGGALTLFAQGGMPAGDLPGSQWKSFTSLAIAARHGPIFTATLVPNKGDVSATSATGVWGCDFNGTPRLLFRTGDKNIVPNKTLKSFTLLNATVGSTGVTRSFNDGAEIVWLATFKEDKSTAIIHTNVP